MSLDNYRSHFDKILVPIAKHLKGIGPNTCTWLAFLLAVAAGYLFYTGTVPNLLLASLCVALSGLLDALDGTIARVIGKASKRGDLLDHVLDRYADIFILGGIALSPWCGQVLGFFAILGVLLTSYMGTQAQALAGKRNYGGFLGRATRLVILIIAPLVQYAAIALRYFPPYFTIIAWMMLFFAVVGNLTAVQRSYKTWKILK